MCPVPLLPVRPNQKPHARAPRAYGAFVVLLTFLGSAGCAKTYAAAPRPDLSGVWDVAYDDYIDAELRIGETVHHARLPRQGGRLVAAGHDLTVELDVDCARDELLCPNEVWPGELSLTNRLGDFDDDGEHLTVSLAGEGSGSCTLKSDSVLGANVLSLGSARDGQWQATTLSLGRVTTVVTGDCLGADGEASRVSVALSSGMSALRR